MKYRDGKSLQNSTGKTLCLKICAINAQNRAKINKNAKKVHKKGKTINKKLREKPKNLPSCEKLAHVTRPLHPPVFISDEVQKKFKLES